MEMHGEARRHADTRRHMETPVDTWRHIEMQRANWGQTDETQTHLATLTMSGRPRDVPSHVSHVSMSWTEILEIREQPGENETMFGRRPGDLTIQRAPPHLQTDARCGHVGNTDCREPSHATLPCVKIVLTRLLQAPDACQHT